MLSKKAYIESEPEIGKELLHFFDRSDALVIVDAGACEGEDSIRYGRFFPNATIYSFEPHPGNIGKFRRNLEEFPNPKIHLVEKALADKPGKMKLFESSGRPEGVEAEAEWDFGNKSHSLLEPGKLGVYYPWLKFSSTVDVDVTTLADFAKTNKVQHIDLLHADVQGAEKLLLEGAGDLLPRISTIWIEASNVALYKNQVLKKDLESFLEKRGFSKVIDKVGKVDGDLFFVSNRLFTPNEKPGTFSHAIQRVKNKLLGVNEAALESYSQCGEDRIIQFIFQALQVSRPSYLDIGAFNPFFINNTALFYRQGATGWNVEPNPHLIRKFEKERPRDRNLSIGISDTAGTAPFYIMKQPTLSTFSRPDAERMQAEMGIAIVETIGVKVMSLPAFIEEECNGKFPNLLSLDVEGLDLAIVRSMHDCSTLPKVICAETVAYAADSFGPKNKELIAEIEKLGYRIYADTFVNTIFLRNDLWK